MTFDNNKKDNLPVEVGYVSWVDKCKFLQVLFNINGNSNKEINNRVNDGRNIIRSLNSILWDKSLRKTTRKWIYKTMVQCIMIRGV
jgi:hypothetical protein